MSTFAFRVVSLIFIVGGFLVMKFMRVEGFGNLIAGIGIGLLIDREDKVKS